jgi:site-specific DNA recombinase
MIGGIEETSASFEARYAPRSYPTRLVEAEKRGTKIKKKLDVDPVEAETARLIFKLYLYGDGNSGALGVKEVVKWLNRNGYRTRRGETFGVASVHKILTNTVYIGQWKFNKTSSRTRQRKPDEEVVTIPVPSLIDPQLFEQVQRQRHARSPRVVAPRVTTGPILLTGLAVCATCRGGMTLRTGTSQNGVIQATTPVRHVPAKARAPVRVDRSEWTSWTGLSPSNSWSSCSNPSGSLPSWPR